MRLLSSSTRYAVWMSVFLERSERLSVTTAFLAGKTNDSTHLTGTWNERSCMKVLLVLHIPEDLIDLISQCFQSCQTFQPQSFQ